MSSIARKKLLPLTYLSQASSLNLKPEAAGTSRGVSATAHLTCHHLHPPQATQGSPKKLSLHPQPVHCHTARLP
eukprot:scaffold9949_cov146-Isochrysis_galbana.AAC.1